MNFTTIKNRIKKAVIISGYSRTAKELSFLSNRQLADLGISRELLHLGASAYPWREEEVSQVIPVNVTNLSELQTATYAPIKPQTPKAA